MAQRAKIIEQYGSVEAYDEHCRAETQRMRAGRREAFRHERIRRNRTERLARADASRAFRRLSPQRNREHRPGTTRRTASSSSTSAADPPPDADADREVRLGAGASLAMSRSRSERVPSLDRGYRLMPSLNGDSPHLEIPDDAQSYFVGERLDALRAAIESGDKHRIADELYFLDKPPEGFAGVEAVAGVTGRIEHSSPSAGAQPLTATRAGASTSPRSSRDRRGRSRGASTSRRGRHADDRQRREQRR